MLRIRIDKQISSPSLVTTSNGDPVDVSRARGLSYQSVVTVDTPSAKAFAPGDVDVTANTITEAAHGYTTGLKGQASNSGGGLPGGLAAVTDYFVIVVDVDTYKLASSLVNALAGTPIDITTQGTGTHTFTPTSLAGATVKWQKSNDPLALRAPASAAWTDIAAATSITASGDQWLEVVDPMYRAIRQVFTLTAGRMSVTTNVVTKE